MINGKITLKYYYIENKFDKLFFNVWNKKKYINLFLFSTFKLVQEWPKHKSNFHWCTPFPLFQSDQDQSSVTPGNDHEQKEPVDKESLSVTICVKCITVKCWFLNLAFFAIHILSVNRLLLHVSISKYPKFFKITLYSIASELDGKKKRNQNPGLMYWARTCRAVVFFQICQKISLPYSQTPCAYTYTWSCLHCLAPSKHWGLGKEVQYSSHLVPSFPSCF